eukprot:gene19595-25499_t
MKQHDESFNKFSSNSFTNNLNSGDINSGEKKKAFPPRNDICKVLVTGVVGTDTRENYLKNSHYVVSFSLAVMGHFKAVREWEETNNTTWINCEVWDEEAKKYASKIQKGSSVSLSNICKLASISISTLSGPLFGGGFLSGGLHAVTGPDHLAAILPSSIGQSGWRGMKLGAIWGLGHGFSAIILGITAFIVKGKVSSKFKFLHNLSTFAESAVGLSLIAIGLLGLKENIFDSNDQELLAIDRQRDSRAIFANGLLHGFSWDGAPSLAPALAMSTWESILGFLLSYCIGTTFAMSLAVGLLSEGSTRLGKVVKSPDLTKTLSIISSILAILIGAFWILKSTLIK